MPDFANLRKALLSQGEPTRVPLYEGSVHEDIKSAFLGKPMVGLESEVNFWMSAGYDYVPLTVGFRNIVRGEEGGITGAKSLKSSVMKSHKAKYNPFSGEDNLRTWAEEDKGVITNLKEFDDFPWPEPEDFDLSTLEKLATLIPDGAEMIVNIGYTLTEYYMN